ncbi:hypothetical protein KC340_g132 [Hortaea werneckii]|nr:hypothetical protein KC340_g132 [Hortaea werneckii]
MPKPYISSIPEISSISDCQRCPSLSARRQSNCQSASTKHRLTGGLTKGRMLDLRYPRRVPTAPYCLARVTCRQSVFGQWQGQMGQTTCSLRGQDRQPTAWGPCTACRTHVPGGFADVQACDGHFQIS